MSSHCIVVKSPLTLQMIVHSLPAPEVFLPCPGQCCALLPPHIEGYGSACLLHWLSVASQAAELWRFVKCRKLVYDELYAKVKEKAAKEEKRRKRAREDFMGLLKDMRDINMDTSWEVAKPLLEAEAEYKAVSSPYSTRNLLINAFSTYPSLSEGSPIMVAC